MIAMGSNEIQLWGDGWTVVTKDGQRAAQYGAKSGLNLLKSA